jgi:hypothetical protein
MTDPYRRARRYLVAARRYGRGRHVMMTARAGRYGRGQLVTALVIPEPPEPWEQPQARGDVVYWRPVLDAWMQSLRDSGEVYIDQSYTDWLAGLPFKEESDD